MTERDDQAALVRWATQVHGLFVRKIVCAGHRGFPDLLIGCKATKQHMFLELKTHTGRLSALQRGTLLAMNACGMNAYSAFSLDEAKMLVSSVLKLKDAP